MVSILDAETDCREQLERVVSILRSIENAINAAPGADHRRMLRLRYIDGLLWSEVAVCLHCTERWLYKEKQKALASIPDFCFADIR